MANIFVTGRIPADGVEALRQEGHHVEVWSEDGAIPRQVLLEKVRGVDALLTLLTERVDDALLDAAGPQLRVVSNVAVGFNNIDVGACTDRRVVATNTPGVLTDATADIAMALVLMVTRRLGEGERVVRSPEAWQWGMFHLLGTSIQGRRLGVVGLGAIGAATARRARAFGMKIAATNRTSATDRASALDCELMSIDELLATSDIISIHCPYSPATHHLIDGAAFSKMKPTAYLINTARGPIVDEAALVNALETRLIAGAGLDVYENEPTVHPGLLNRDDVVLIPHLGSATVETRTAMALLAAANAAAVLRGDSPPTPINEARLL